MHFCIRVGISAQNRMIPSLAFPQVMQKNWQRGRLRERENTRGVSLASNPRLRNQLKIKSGNNATTIVSALYKIMNYTLIPALISASSSEVISFVMFLATVLLYLFSPIFVYIFALRGNQFALRGIFSHNIVITTLRKPNNPSGLKLRRGYYIY